MRILVTGGAGYVGSHAALVLSRAGHDVWVYDNLSQGHRAAVQPGKLIEGSLDSTEMLCDVLKERQIESVMHFAAVALVGESVTDPAKYYRNNVLGSYWLLEAMRKADVRRIVFSSTTATYGAPRKIPIDESTPQEPINPYGFSKLVVERMLDHYAEAYGFAFAALRYFNAAGADPSGQIGEDHTPESHLIPLVLQVALGQRPQITIFGNDYPTPDGTCIRDYVHVNDLAAAHLLALSCLRQGQGLKLNLGTGRGHSVAEVINACRRITGREIPTTLGTRRPGDPPTLVADSSLARSQLSWTPEFAELDQIVQTAWNWHSRHPSGYPK